LNRKPLLDTDLDGLPDETENGDSLHIKILERDDILEDGFTQYWTYETWREKRPYKYVSIIEQEAQHSTANPPGGSALPMERMTENDESGY
jgi:hypothetical protein